MQRDMDLVRTILLTLEAHESAFVVTDSLVITGYHTDLVIDHIVLMAEAGLVGVIAPATHGDDEQIRITWAGHEFLANARDDATWRKARSIAGKVGSASFGVIVHVLTGVIDAKLKAAGIF